MSPTVSPSSLSHFSLGPSSRKPGLAVLIPLFYALLAALFLGRSTLGGDVFLPAGLLGYMHPYSAKIRHEGLPPWNPLRWDGIGQFFPWRHFAAQSVHAGTLPLWNPYQFCGTPFVANSQSAVFYPGNLLFYLMPTAQAFNWSALLHLTLCGWFTYLLIRSFGRSTLAALLGGVIFAYSSWQVAWLQLPTFLATSCWLPLLLRQITRAIPTASPSDQAGPRPRLQALGIAPVVGLMMLAGHLQVAFYGLLTGTLWTVALAIRCATTGRVGRAAPLLGACLLGLALGLLLAAPQLLPALELSRRSHRVTTPTQAGYAAYVEYALPSAGLVTLTLPDFFGNDYDPQNPYWGYYTKEIPNGPTFALRHNAAETALYVGIVPLLLAGLAIASGLRPDTRDRRIWFFAALALLSLLLALGTPLNALFYFGIPGFGQSGSPARALVLWALAVAVLAAFGLDALRAKQPGRRSTVGLLTGLALLIASGLALAAKAIGAGVMGLDQIGFADHLPPVLGEVLFNRLNGDWLRLAVMTVGGTLLILPLARRPLSGRPEIPALVPGALLLTVIDLFSAGFFSNPTAPADQVYPETAGIRYLRENVGHERIFPINRRWGLLRAPADVLPPNGATAYGLRDVQGYDSLLTGQYKAFANRFARPNAAGSQDASPPEVGNMVFFQNPGAPETPILGATFALTPSTDAPEFADTNAPSGSPVYSESDEMAIYRLPDALPRARFVPDSGAVPEPVHYLEDGPTRVSLDLSPAESGTLVLADALYPGWQVAVDSHPATFSTNTTSTAGVFRAVKLAAGRHRVDFRYVPSSFRVGLFLALSSLLVHLMALCARIAVRRPPVDPA